MMSTLLSNIRYEFAAYWRFHKATAVRAVLAILARVAGPFTGILLPKVVLDALTAGVAPSEFLARVGLAGAAWVLLTFLKNVTDFSIDQEFGMLGSQLNSVSMLEKYITMDYELLEDPTLKPAQDKALTAVANNHTHANNLLKFAGELIVQSAGFLLYGIVISSVNPLILLLLLASAAVSALTLRWARAYEAKTRDGRSKMNRKIEYIIKLLKDTAAAKDIRMYALLPSLRALASRRFKEYADAETQVASKTMATQLLDALLLLLRDGAAYAYLIYLLLNNRIGIGDFTLVFAAIGGMAAWMNGIVLQYSEMMRGSSELSDVRAYLDIKDRTEQSEGHPLPQYGQAPGFTVENATYRYPEAAAPTLEHLNFSIKPGERLAIVGVNGAGKTTLIKLLCGLYKPTEGRVLLNGVDTKLFNRDKYFSLFSAVFQDVYLLADTVAVNVSQQPDGVMDRAEVECCLRLSGLWDKVTSLPQGMDTMLVRKVEPDAVALSGGETQKLALARAIYRKAPVILLDEPTAALDPIAENETYQRYAELTACRTSVYISHRLASTRFCDRILMLDGKHIIEEGTHDELMRLNGRYAEMFSVQASYYKTNKNYESLEPTQSEEPLYA
ncbi:ABC transporter ATP-binding protein [Clostridia bacterium]|nr:ABC transporter ATP-binding protein [Clostridia bacterium]